MTQQTPSPWNLSAPAPSPEHRPTVRRMHGHDFTDPFEWMREKESPEVLAHLEAENAYAESVTEHLAGLRAEIFSEIKERTQETDLSVPTRQGQYWYYRRTTEGKEHPVFCRVPARDRGDRQQDWTPPVIEPGAELPGEEVLLDGNLLAEGLPFFSLGSFMVTLDGRLMTYAVDDSGDERYTQYVKNLDEGEMLEDVLPEVFAGGFLTPDGSHLVYSQVDESWRPYTVVAHRLGTPVEQDVVLFHEPEPGMWLGAMMASDQEHLIIESGCAEYNEVRWVDLEALDQATRAGQAPELSLLLPREAGVLCEVEPLRHAGTDCLLVIHDAGAPDGELVLVPMPAAAAASTVAELAQAWRVLLPGSSGRRLGGMALSRTHLGLGLRERTLEKVAFLPLEALAQEGDLAAALVEPDFGHELFTAGMVSMSVHSPVVGISFQSFTTPPRRYDWFPQEQVLHLRRETPVLGGYRPEDYVAERQWVTAGDGTQVPVSVLRRSDLDLSVPHPVLQYGYGSYESSADPRFSVARLSLLDRGVVVVQAHVRGGGELGRSWYLEGKKLRKKNTFTDFVDVTAWLGQQPWADAERIAAWGGSAGGLLMGAVANMAPERYCGILAAVPFVDPVTSIADPDLPLSALEWEEWGNPITDPEVYRYMVEYSPYENVADLPYPPIAAVTSLNDTRVLYVEPAKWVPALREHTTSGAPVLLRTEMDGGHGGGSGRYRQWEDTAWEFAFLLGCLGICA